jgi:hypothetical protein
VCDGSGLAGKLDSVAGQVLLEVEVKVAQGVVDANGGKLAAMNSAQPVDLTGKKLKLFKFTIYGQQNTTNFKRINFLYKHCFM